MEELLERMLQTMERGFSSLEATMERGFSRVERRLANIENALGIPVEEEEGEEPGSNSSLSD